MAKELDVTAHLKSGVHFNVKTGSGYTIGLDMLASEGGMGSGPQPMEMLLVGMAGCIGMSNLIILRKRKQEIRAYEIHVHGIRASVHPEVFTEIIIEHVITGRALLPEVIERAMKMTEEKYCGASAMLEKTALIKHTWRIVEVG